MSSPCLSQPLTATDVALIDLALQEDLGVPFCDVTTQLLFTHAEKMACAKIVCKHTEPIVLCGLPIVTAILNKFTSRFTLTTTYADGEIIKPGATLLQIKAPVAVLLMAERTLLNFLQRLSAVATLTAKYVAAVKHTSLKILDTRKTTPGMRHLQKYAVRCGGGANHRLGLYDAVLIKDTHIALAGGIEPVLMKLTPQLKQSYPVIIEVSNLKELNSVLQYGRDKVTRVLLDNMALPLLAEGVALCKGIFQTEASGNINLENIQTIAQTAVEFASIGGLTHSAGSVDLSMQGVN